MRLRALILSCGLCVGLLACSDEITFDTTSRETMDASLEHLTQGLSDADKEVLTVAVIRASFGPDGTEINAYHGLTGPEIIALYEAQLAAETARVRQDFETFLASLDAYKLDAAVYDWDEAQEWPTVSYAVTNDGEKTITGLKLRVRLNSPDRDSAWFEDISDHHLADGLAPGDTRSIDLATGTLSIDWRDLGLHGRDDLDFAAEIVGVELEEEDTFSISFEGSDFLALEKTLRDLEAKITNNSSE